jgi:hypothetical protein
MLATNSGYEVGFPLIPDVAKEVFKGGNVRTLPFPQIAEAWERDLP